RDQRSAIAVIEQLERELEKSGVDANEILRREHRRQAANQISVGNCVISLRLLSALDWNDFFERINVVEAVLREDPARKHALQEFAAGDRYRRVLEKIARGSDTDELTVARRVVTLAREAIAQGKPDAQGHVGYYLVDRGLDVITHEFHTRAPWREGLLGWVR